MTVPHSEPPVPAVACSLNLHDLGDRVRSWAPVGRQALVERNRHPQGVVLRYRREQEIEDELRRLLGLEGECCSFLTFDLAETGPELVLNVSGPGDAVPLIHECWG